MDRIIEVNGIKYTRQGAEYNHQMKKVLSCLGENMLEAITAGRGIIAGGAITSAFTHQEINDIDVYFRSQEDLAMAFVIATTDFENIYLGHTEKSITLKDKDTDAIIQFIFFDYFKDAEAVFEAFDFTVCMGAIEVGLSPEQDQLILHPNFLGDVASRTLRFNTGTRFPYISLVRTKKYQSKGYKIGKGNLISIGVACANYPISSWADAKEQLGGVYGYEIDIKETNEDEFSQEALIEMLGEIRDDFRPYINAVGDYTKLYHELTGIDYNNYTERTELEKKARSMTELEK